MTAPTLDTYEALLEENDHDLYQWVTGQTAAPAPFAALIGEITAHTGAATPG
jgi:antitoxin CptB